jgi:thiopeptide-type bacteriocin biosynthesis protein
LVAVRDNRVILRSRRLDKEVIPRLTTAHNFGGRNIGVYKFLCVLQSQGVQESVRWSWGTLEDAPFLPRVSSGRLVLARARWQINRSEIHELTKEKDHQRFATFQSWRARRGLPQLVELTDFDNTLPLDLNNIVCIEVLLELIKNRYGAVLREIFPGPDLLIARGPEGVFTHELVIPFVRTTQEPAPDRTGTETPGQFSTPAPSPTARREKAPLDVPHIGRSFPPGSEWLFAKLYCGTSNADQILREVVGPVTQEARRSGAATGWFFIRYGDPGWHIRLRLRGDPARLSGDVIPLLHNTAAPLFRDGRLQRLQLDTYEREIERYGGPAGMQPAEEMFQADSEAVLAIIRQLTGDSGADARWRLTLLGIDLLLTDLGLEQAQKLAVMDRMRLGFWEEFYGNKPLKEQLGLRFRKERAELETLIAEPAGWVNQYRTCVQALAGRSGQWEQAISRLQAASGTGVLTKPLESLAASFAHMHANRLLRSSARAHELVIYDFLARLYRSQIARGG